MSLRRVVPNVQSIFRQFEDSFNNMLSRVPTSMVSPTSTSDFFSMNVPVADVRETEKSYMIEAELPGVPKENVSMELLDDHNLRLSGHFARESTQQDQTRSLWAKERMMGEFRRTFSFPTKLTPEQIKATMDSGVLKIEIIKGEEESKKIPIKID